MPRTPSPADAIRAWQRAATPAQQETLAEKVRALLPSSRFSRAYLYQLAGGHRNITAELAAAIERATVEMTVSCGTPILWRYALSSTCSGCAFAARCRAGVAQ